MEIIRAVMARLRVPQKPTPVRIAICVFLCLVVLLICPVGLPLSLWAESEADRRIDFIEKDNASIHAEHYMIVNQLSSTTKGLVDLTEAVNKHHEAQAGYPAFLATLDVKLNWLLAGIGSVLVGGFGWMLNRVRYAGRVEEKLRFHAAEVLRYQEAVKNETLRVHESVVAAMDSIKSEAHLGRDEAQAAYAEASQVNRKIESLGESIMEKGVE